MDRTPEQIFDEWLVIRSQDGEADAMTQLVTRWNDRLVRFAVGVIGADDAARDAVQSAWLVAARDIRRLRDPARFAGWMCGIISNKCADRIRRDRRERRTARQWAEQNTEGFVNRPGSAGDNDDVARLRGAMSRLGLAQREILSLHYGAGLGVARIAGMLGVPEGTVKSRLHAARNELKSILERMHQ